MPEIIIVASRTSSSEAVRAHVSVIGRVQGVFFRAGARDEGRRLGVTGWVRNVADGSVELVIEGDKFAVGRMLQWCTRGPPGAEVTDMQTKWEEPEGKWDSFNIAW